MFLPCVSSQCGDQVGCDQDMNIIYFKFLGQGQRVAKLDKPTLESTENTSRGLEKV